MQYPDVPLTQQIMKFGVVIFPGSPGAADVARILADVLKQEVCEIWHRETALPDFTANDCIILPSGFSFGDYIRPGAIACYSPVMKAVHQFAQSGGYILGIGNGFQILCEAGLLPGKLIQNKSRAFICRNAYLSPMTRRTALTARIMDLEIPLKIPVAHGFGRYVANDATLDELESGEQVLFTYSTEGGEITDACNPDGSERNIAGICNSSRNIFGLMPMPERAAEEVLRNTDGSILFESIIETIQAVEAV